MKAKLIDFILHQNNTFPTLAIKLNTKSEFKMNKVVLYNKIFIKSNKLFSNNLILSISIQLLPYRLALI